MGIVTGVLVSAAAILLAPALIELALRWFDWADPPIFQHAARYGYVMRPHQSVSTRGRRFRINNVGLRGEDVGRRGDRERRLVFVGDSIAYGGGRIADAELFVNRIAGGVSASMQQHVSGVNVAAPGWGIQNMAAFLAEYDGFDADALVWIVPSADFRRPLTSLHQFAFPETRPRSRAIYVARSWARAMQPRRGSQGPRPSSSDILSANLRALDGVLRRMCGIPRLLVVLPGERGYGRLADHVARFASVAAANGAMFVNLAQVLRERDHEQVFDDHVHLNARGHEVVTEALLPVIAEMLAPAAWKRTVAAFRPGGEA
jgi:GDSL-like Lipase/Acylhydrolase family